MRENVLLKGVSARPRFPRRADRVKSCTWSIPHGWIDGRIGAITVVVVVNEPSVAPGRSVAKAQRRLAHL